MKTLKLVCSYLILMDLMPEEILRLHYFMPLNGVNIRSFEASKKYSELLLVKKCVLIWGRSNKHPVGALVSLSPGE